MKRALILVTACLLALALALPVHAEPKGTLRVALTADPNALDLAAGDDRNASNVACSIFDPLVWLDDDGEVVPCLAESWTISEDGTEFVFNLRQGVTFHNGAPLTADDVVATWQRGLSDNIKYKEHYTVAKTVEKLDSHTVRVTTDSPKPLLLRIMADNWGIIPGDYYAEVGESGFIAHPVGTGPFKFVKWARGDRIELTANLDYWQAGLPKVKTLIYRPIPESTTRLAAIRAGEVDIVTRLNAEEADSLKGIANVKVRSYFKDRVYYIAFNNLTTGKDQPTMEPKVRQAMNLAVDIDAIIEALFSGHARAISGFVVEGNLGYAPDRIAPIGYDPERARSLLAEAGFANGFAMEMACPSGVYINFEQVCEAIQGFLGEVGITVDLQLMESGQYWDLEAKKELPPLFGDSWSNAIGEAFTRLQGALDGWDASYSAWYDPKIGDFLKRIAATMDDGARGELYVQLQQYMQDNPPFIYLYQPKAFEAINPKVKGYLPRPAEQYYLKAVSVE